MPDKGTGPAFAWSFRRRSETRAGQVGAASGGRLIVRFGPDCRGLVRIGEVPTGVADNIIGVEKLLSFTQVCSGLVGFSQMPRQRDISDVIKPCLIL